MCQSCRVNIALFISIFALNNAHIELCADCVDDLLALPSDLFPDLRICWNVGPTVLESSHQPHTTEGT